MMCFAPNAAARVRPRTGCAGKNSTGPLDALSTTGSPIHPRTELLMPGDLLQDAPQRVIRGHIRGVEVALDTGAQGALNAGAPAGALRFSRTLWSPHGYSPPSA